MEPYMHGAIYTWSCIRMEPYTHGAVYAWSRICMEPYTCGASSLPLLPACSPCSLSIPGSLELSWGLRKPPAHSPCFQLAPSRSQLSPTSHLSPASQLAPDHSQLTPAHSQLAPNGQCMCGGPHHLWGVRGKVGVSWSELGSKLE